MGQEKSLLAYIETEKNEEPSQEARYISSREERTVVGG
jgi:hypothetical protein